MKDALRNDLEVGDAVHIKVENTWIPGVIMKLQEGGLSLAIAVPPGQPAPQTPDTLVIQLTFACPEPHGMPHGTILKLCKPPESGTVLQ